MKKAHKPLSAHLEYDEQRCITDWATTHWAMLATPENLQKIIQAPKAE
jgi:hypothetical protein